MAIYHYKQAVTVDRVEIHMPHPGISQATIIAKNGITATQLEGLRAQLGDKFSTLMDTIDGRAAIQVRGFHEPKDLLGVLHKIGQDRGGYQIQDQPGDHKRKENFVDGVRGKALFLSAIFYDLGNAAFFASGIQRARHNDSGKATPHDISEFMTGAAFTAGDLLLTAYGHDKGDEELRAASNGLKKHLHQKGIQLPRGDALDPDSLYQSGALKATDRWLRNNIIQLKCLSEFIGGLTTIHASLKKDCVNKGKLVAGLLITTGWASTFLLEKPRGHEVFDTRGEPTNPVETVMRDPRGLIARPLAMGNNIANLWGALGPNGERLRMGERAATARSSYGTGDVRTQRAEAGKHDYIWNVISAGCFLVAHTLFGISGEKRPKETDDDKRMMNDLVLMSANLLMKQPEAVREQTISETADYVSKLAHVTLPKEQLADAIRAKITELSQSSWAGRVQAAGLSGRAV